jgi:hypothetical protein
MVAMNIVSLNGHTFDLDEVVVTHLEPNSVHLTFRNGDRILLAWRDEIERKYILAIVDRSA